MRTILSLSVIALCTMACSRQADAPTDPWVEKGYTLVWADEFNLPNGQYDNLSEKWNYAPRGTAVWNRFNSPRADLYMIEDSALVLYGRPNADMEADSVDFNTGALNTRGIFGTEGGVIEARIKTNAYTGNFPAFWMMPVASTESWPECGEIDIWEQIDDENRSYHTTHGYWTNIDDGGRSANIDLDMSDWHTYALEWLPDRLIWYVDGEVVSEQIKDEADEHPHAWPFDKEFFIIINQAVGADYWAKMYDPTHTYHTAYDYVRAYNKL